MIREVFNKSSGYLESTWEGDTSLQEVVDYIRRTKENRDYPRKLKILTLAVTANLALSIEDLKVISKENRLSVERYDAIIDAFIVDAGVVAALSTMYQKVSTVKNYFFKIFSTREAAVHWLEIM